MSSFFLFLSFPFPQPFQIGNFCFLCNLHSPKLLLSAGDFAFPTIKQEKQVALKVVLANPAKQLSRLLEKTELIMSKRKQRLEKMDKRDSQKFLTVLGVAVLILMLLLYLVYRNM